MNAVIYARYSSHAQREESIEGQLRECYEYAKRNDLRIIDEYIDRAISGRTDERPAFQRMIRDSDARKFEVVLVYALDRFARNRYDSAIYKARLKKNGVRVMYAKTSIPDSPEGIILESVMEGYAEYYSENLKIHVRRGMHENALEAKSNGGNIPLGFKIVDHRYTVEPIGAAIVKDIFEMTASGVAPSVIVDTLNARGCRTATGKPFGRTSLQRIIGNKKYIGTYVFDGTEIPDAIPAIVHRELFEKVQEMQNEKKEVRPRKRSAIDYMLTGRLYCGRCGGHMVGESGKGKLGKIYAYYNCSSRKQRQGCIKRPEPKDALEEMIVQAAAQMLTDETIEEIAERAHKILIDELENDTLIAELKAKQAVTQTKLNNLLALAEEGLESVTKRIKELEELSRDTERQLAHELAAHPILTKEQIIYWLEQFRQGDVTDPNFRRALIDALVSRVFAYDDTDGTHRYVVAFNLSKNNTRTLTLAEADAVQGSDNSTLGEPLRTYPNTYIIGAMIVAVIHV